MQLVSLCLFSLYMFRTRCVSIIRSGMQKLKRQPPVCVNACGMCPLSQGRVSMRMMCVLISLLHEISTILSVTKNVGVLSCVAILVL